MSEPNEIVRTSRQVIERKLLTALEDGKSVAVIFTESDLDIVAMAMEYFDDPKTDELALSFRQLQREAFPK